MKSYSLRTWISALALAGLLSGGPLLAENDWKPQGSPEEHLKHMSKKLDLTEAQQAEMKKAMEELHAQMETLRTQREEMMKKHEERVMSILDDKQKAKFQEMKDKRKAKKEERMEKKHDKDHQH